MLKINKEYDNILKLYNKKEYGIHVCVMYLNCLYGICMHIYVHTHIV